MESKKHMGAIIVAKPFASAGSRTGRIPSSVRLLVEQAEESDWLQEQQLSDYLKLVSLQRLRRSTSLEERTAEEGQRKQAVEGAPAQMY